MASVGGNLARDDWDDFGIGVPGSQMTNGTYRFAVPVASRTERSFPSYKRRFEDSWHFSAIRLEMS